MPIILCDQRTRSIQVNLDPMFFVKVKVEWCRKSETLRYYYEDINPFIRYGERKSKIDI